MKTKNFVNIASGGGWGGGGSGVVGMLHKVTYTQSELNILSTDK